MSDGEIATVTADGVWTVSYTHLDVYKRQALGSVRIVRKAVDARKKNDICLNYHVLAEVETGGRQAKRLLADRDITQYQEQQQPTLELGTLPLSAPVSYTHLDVYKRQQSARAFGDYRRSLCYL